MTVRVKGQLASLYKAQVTAEKHLCPHFGGQAQVQLHDGKVYAVPCCDAYGPDIQALIGFNR